MFTKKFTSFAALTAVISLAVPGNALAGNIYYEADTTIAVGSINLVILANSRADAVEVRSDSVVITVGNVNETLSIVSNNNYQLNTSPSTSQICGSGQSRVNITNNTVTITPVAQTASCPSTVLAPSGGGGGGAAASVAVNTSTGGGTVAALNVYDVPDTGKASANAAVASSTDAKLRLDIVKDTKFKTDVKKQKVVNYTDIVRAPAVVENKDVVLDKKDPAAKATLLLAAKAETTAKQVKLSKFAMLSMPITEAQKQLGIKKLKAYYIDQNTGKAKALSGSKINTTKNLFIAKLKQLGGVVILTQKK